MKKTFLLVIEHLCNRAINHCTTSNKRLIIIKQLYSMYNCDYDILLSELYRFGFTVKQKSFDLYSCIALAGKQIGNEFIIKHVNSESECNKYSYVEF